MELTKVCTKCLAEKSVSEFRKQTKNKDGLKYYCKTCDDILNTARYHAKKDLIKLQVKAWQANHPDKVKQYKLTNYLNKRKNKV